MGTTLTRTSNNIPFLLRLTAPHCDPFRKMIVHPEIISRLRVMCGQGFRVDHGPQFGGGVPEALRACSTSITAGTVRSAGSS